MEADIQQALQRVARQDQGEGKTRIDVVDDYAYPVPVAVICKILGVPLKDEPLFHAWIHDFMAGVMDMGPEAATEEGKARKAKGQAGAAAIAQYMTGLIKGFLKEPERQHALEDGERRRPGRPHDAQGGRDQCESAARRRS